MQCPDIPENEEARLATLYRLKILDTKPEQRFDRYTRLSQRVFDMPMAIISLVDRHRQWFKSKQGLRADETPRDVSFCGHAILGDDVFEIRNARRDPRFRDNPLVVAEPHIRFYAGAPLVAPDGQKLGTLCILDRVPRRLEDEEKSLLTDLAEMVVDEMTAYIDADSGLLNRNGMRSLGARALAAALPGQRFELLLFDVSHLVSMDRRVRDSAREGTLSSFAELLREHLPDSRLMAHLNGGNFAVLRSCNETLDRNAAVRDLQRAATKELAQDAAGEFTSVFVGEIGYDRTAHPTIDELVRKADAMFFSRARKSASALPVRTH